MDTFLIFFIERDVVSLSLCYNQPFLIRHNFAARIFISISRNSLASRLQLIKTYTLIFGREKKYWIIHRLVVVN